MVEGSTTLTEAEERLLDRLTAPLGACPTCGAEGLYLAAWTPLRTVARIVCPVCFRTLWEAL